MSVLSKRFKRVKRGFTGSFVGMAGAFATLAVVLIAPGAANASLISATFNFATITGTGAVNADKCTSSTGATVNPCNGTLGNSTVYTDTIGGSIMASGYFNEATNGSIPTVGANGIYAGNSALDAITGTSATAGLGLATGTGIVATSKDMIVLNLGYKFRFQDITLVPGAVTGSDTIDVVEWNLGPGGTTSSIITQTGSNAGITLNAGYQYIGIYATSGNVLLSSLMVDIPEPGSLAILGGGIIALAAARRRRII